MCLYVPLVALVLTGVAIALGAAIFTLVRPSEGAALTATWLGVLATPLIGFLLSFEIGQKYGPSGLGWFQLALFAIAVVSVALGTRALSAQTPQKRRWRYTALVLAVLLLLTSALLTVEAIAGARRSRELREELEREHGIKFPP